MNDFEKRAHVAHLENTNAVREAAVRELLANLYDQRTATRFWKTLCFLALAVAAVCAVL